jgi:hypothetical protein
MAHRRRARDARAMTDDEALALIRAGMARIGQPADDLADDELRRAVLAMWRIPGTDSELLAKTARLFDTNADKP